MMADSVVKGEGERSNAGGSATHALAAPAEAPAEAPAGEPAAAYDQARAASAHARAYEHALTYARLRAYVSLAAKITGLLALLLSTVILLGGYVQSLGKKDFFCILAITVIQAAGIFQDWDNLQHLTGLSKIFLSVQGFIIAHNPALALVVLPFTVLSLCVPLLFYLLGPLVCAAISSWRIAKLNHDYKRDGTDSMTDMMATLNIFYSLIIFQGTMFGVLLFTLAMGNSVVASRLLAREQLPPEKWAKDVIGGYIIDISVKCRKDPLSVKGRDLIMYAAELLDSESQEDYMCGARLLSAFVNKGEDVRWLLLPSRHRHRIQRLIDSLMISSNSIDEACIQLDHHTCVAVIGSLDEKREIRELAATIVAHVAAHIDDLSNYPGAMRCISSLLQDQEETTQTYWNRNSKQLPDDPPPHQRPIGHLTEWESYKEERMLSLIKQEEERHIDLMLDQNRMVIREHRHRSKREGGTSNELVQQGLTILVRLASKSDDNRKIICSTPGLLPKVTAPVSSSTFIEDVKTKAWADIVTSCLKVLYQLIRAPGRPSRRLRRQISSNVQALFNLKTILLDQQGNDEADHQELQLVAMEILTELALDLSINLNMDTKKLLVTKQLQLFLLANGDGDQKSAAFAGRAMVSLSISSVSNSALIMTTQDDIISRLTGVLEDENITRRTVAAEIMAYLCAHCPVDNMKEILPKVLRKIMSIKTKSLERQNSADQNPPAPALEDLEKQGNSVSTKNSEERHYISTQGDDRETEEFSDQEREEQEASLSLAQVICNKLNSADLDGAIQSAVQENNNAARAEQRRETFVVKLKMIIDDNCHPAADSLRIVKLCGQIANSVMRCQGYVEIFRNKGFKSSLSEASKTMSELESCMLFVGTDFGLKKTVRPLLSEIEKTWPEM